MELFAENGDVAFADVNLSEESIRGNHNPGAGGWPTIKYFNKKTGYEGAPYSKLTSKSMCDELGDFHMMQQYVEDYGHTALCSVVTGAGCSDKEKKFIVKASAMEPATVAKQVARLEAMSTGKMAPDLYGWLKQRLSILRNVAKLASPQKDEL